MRRAVGTQIVVVLCLTVIVALVWGAGSGQTAAPPAQPNGASQRSQTGVVANPGESGFSYWALSRTAVQFLAVVIACMTFIYNANVQWFLKQRDVATEYQKRFATLVDAIKKDIKEGHRIDDAFFRFWGLQEEQFEAWLDGLIPNKTYRIWMMYRAHESRQTICRFEVQGKSVSDGWEQVKGMFRDLHFVNFTDAVLAPGGDANATVDAAFKLIEPEVRKRRSRWRLLSLYQ
jgi:hypothetical protein